MDDDAGLQAICQTLGVPLPEAGELDAVLDLTRVVAHSSQRRFGPQAVYALALAMSHDSPSARRAARLRAAIEAIESPPTG